MSAAASSELLGLAAVAFALGMRHGVDAEHLAAIDAMTRCNAQARPALARRTGLWFSAGHGAVVMAVALTVALTAHAWAAPRWLGPFGAWCAIAMLALLGALNLVAWRQAAPDAVLVPAGWRSRLYGGASRACSRVGVMGVGALFAVSFDTLSQAALMAATGTAQRSLAAVVLLAGAFAIGMVLTDGLNGWWVARLMQRPRMDAARASRVMCLAVGGVSLGTAALGGAAELSPAAAAWCARDGGVIALAIVAIVGASFLAGLVSSRSTTTAPGQAA